MGQGSGSQLDLGQFLNIMNKKVPLLGTLLGRLQDAVNNIGTNAAISPVGFNDPPPPIESLTVKASNGLVHAVITHNAPIQKGIQYFLEHDDDPAFPHPHQIDMGASRSHVFQLPGKTDGGADQQFYFRAYPQYHGSLPGQKTIFGGDNATAVAPGGTTQLSLIPSTGSGTSSPDGQQGGQGLGTVLLRPPIGAKRADLNS